MPLTDPQGQSTDLAAKLGLFGDNALELNSELVSIDWHQRLNDSSLVGKQGESLPLIFDGRTTLSSSLLALRSHTRG